jgi:ATP-dependent exoDNAse (exonuclease V) beta subunit
LELKLLTSPELSSEQELAVTSTEQSLVVSAAAGSGKTRVLVERYLKHVIDEGFRADQILTITFTRKAAAEMKRRIVDRLTDRGLLEQAQIAETGPIQTVHGFCERLLRENSLAAGLDPEFEILSEAQSSRLLEVCIQETLATEDPENEEAEQLIRKLAGRRSYGESFSPHARLETAIRDALHSWRGTGVTVQELERDHRSPVALLGRWRDKLLASIDGDVRTLYEQDQSGDSFASKLITAFKTLRRAKPRFIRPSVEADIEAAADTCGLMQLVCEVWQRYESKMRAQQALDFSALESYAVQLLSRSKPTQERVQTQYPIVLIDEAQDLNPVQYALLAAMHPKTEMFVGDHQQSIYGFRQADVKLFEKRRVDLPSTRLSRNYRSDEGLLGFVDHLFRNQWGDRYEPMLATPTIAYPGVELWVQRQRDTMLTAQWIKELVDERQQAGKKAGDIAVLVRKSHYAMELARSLERVGVRARISGGTEQFYTRLEVRDLANALEALTDPFDGFALTALLRSPFVELSLDSIVLLGQKKPIIESLKEMVERKPSQDPHPAFLALVSEDGALDPSPISDHDEPHPAFLNSGSGNPAVSDIEKAKVFLQWFLPLSGYADRLAAWELISELFAKTPYLNNLGRREGAMQRLANVRKLLTLAIEEPETDPRHYAERIREIQAIRHKEGDAPAGDQDADEITIMTIHKSKGLEFPVVVLPDTHQKMTKGMKDVEVDPWLKLMSTKLGRSSSMFHDWLASERQNREEEEEWRVMYVALTRAKERLCVVVNPSGAGDKIADKICKLLRYRDIPPPGVVIRETENLRR